MNSSWIRWQRASSLALLAVLFFIAFGCELFGGQKLDPGKSGSILAGSADSPGVQILAPKEKMGFYRWLVAEMHEQIFAKPLKDPGVINSWANVLSQKASVEGVYHGFILSTEYIDLESAKKSADIKALRFYGLEMALMDYPYLTEMDPKIQGASAKYVKDNMNANIFLLKRLLGERILMESAKRKDVSEKLAAWYSGIAARWAKLDIPFGLSQRGNRDEIFHFEWAKANSLGMIQWELLNRQHRVFNHLGGLGGVGSGVNRKNADKADGASGAKANPAGK